MTNYLLSGNPNVGKTTIFNELTGSNERISNYEGVTVSQKSAMLKNTEGILIDLPGINGFSATGRLENLVLDQIINHENSGIINVMDITNFKKNCYFLIDLLETEKNIAVILTMSDLVKSDIDISNLEGYFSTKFYLANRDKTDISVTDITNFKKNKFKIYYGVLFEQAIIELENIIKVDNISKRFLAIQFLKGSNELDKFITDLDLAINIRDELFTNLQKKSNISSLTGYIFLKRRIYINEVLIELFDSTEVTYELKWLNDKFDKLALHKFFGYITFMIIMYLVFYITFNGIITPILNVLSFVLSLINLEIPENIINILSTPVVETMVNNISILTSNLLTIIHTPQVIQAFIVDGIIAGVGGVLVFLPQIIIMFTLLTILEGVGYFSRVNTLFENTFNRLGMSSTSLVPLISGLGCNVLGIMSARNIKSEPKRLATIFSAPFISCSARLPVYVIFTNIFFKNQEALILLFIYMLSIIVAVTIAVIIDKIIYKDVPELNIHALPRYRKISFKYLYRMVKGKVVNFLTKSGKFILVGSIIVWVLSSFSFKYGYTTDITQSIVYNVSDIISFIFTPLGFGNAEAVASLVSAFLAKELAISTMIIMYGVNTTDSLSSILANSYTQASALSYMVFVLLYVPCLATVGVIYSETGRMKYAMYSILLSLIVGYLLSFIVYNISLIVL